MKIYFFIPLITVLWFCSCKKPDFESDLNGIGTINGVVLMHDSYSGSNVYIPMKAITVYLRAGSTPNAFIYSVKTDNLGQFSFTGIDGTINYIIDASYDSAQIHYTGKKNYNNPTPATILKDTLLLDIDPTLQNGIHLVTEDDLGGIMPRATVWVFNSPVLFAADTSAQAAFVLHSNDYGIDNKYSIPAGDYFFRTKTYSNNLILVDEQYAKIENTGIKTVNLTGRLIPQPGFGNGIDIPVVDEAGTPVNNANVYFYKDYDAYLGDEGKFQGSLFKLTTRINGHATSYIVNPGTYFIWVKKSIDASHSLKTTQQQSIVVENSIVTSPAITVK